MKIMLNEFFIWIRTLEPVNSTRPPASDALAARYADLPLPPDARQLASLCADTFDALREAEDQVVRLQASVARNRRIGIVLGIIMAIERVSEPEAERLLRNRGRALRLPMRLMAERIMSGRGNSDPETDDENLASVTPLTWADPWGRARAARS
jgi:hypothetical protein